MLAARDMFLYRTAQATDEAELDQDVRNARYLNALAHVDDPPLGFRGRDTITTREHPATGRPDKAFNPVARSDSQLFIALMRRGALPAPQGAGEDLRHG